MNKLLLSKDCIPIDLDGLTPLPLWDRAPYVRHMYRIQKEYEVYINGEYKCTAQPGDVLLELYGIENRYDKYEHFLLKGELFGDYFERLDAFNKKKEDNKVETDHGQCNCISKI